MNMSGKSGVSSVEAGSVVGSVLGSVVGGGRGNGVSGGLGSARGSGRVSGLGSGGESEGGSTCQGYQRRRGSVNMRSSTTAQIDIVFMDYNMPRMVNMPIYILVCSFNCLPLFVCLLACFSPLCFAFC